MAIKIGNKLIGEDAKEQFELEKRRSRAKQARKENKVEEKRLELIKMAEGNRNLFEFKTQLKGGN